MERFITDGFNLAFRAAYANKDLTGIGGKPSGVVYGFLRTFFTLKKRFNNAEFCVAWDSPDNWRKEIVPKYKANRSEKMEGVIEQIESIKEILSAAGVTQLYKHGFEADDLIADYAGRHKEEGLVYIYSNDKDFLQLVEDGKVSVLKPKIGNSAEKIYDEESVIELFGVPPSRLASFRAFDGDTSDNLEGVPRLPKKVIARLINSYKNVEGVFENLDKEKLTDFQKNSILGHKNSVISNEIIMDLSRSSKKIASDKTELELKTHTNKSPEDRISTIERILEEYSITSKSIDPKEFFTRFFRDQEIIKTDPETVTIETFNLFEE
jgi:DNA polymerase-1